MTWLLTLTLLLHHQSFETCFRAVAKFSADSTLMQVDPRAVAARPVIKVDAEVINRCELSARYPGGTKTSVRITELLQT